MKVVPLTIFANFPYSSDIDVIEWHEFLTPQLKLSQLFKAKPQGDVSYTHLILHYVLNQTANYI